MTCRKRKVRCDKVHPSCGNCAKAHIECIFPSPSRAPNKSRKPPYTTLLVRLKRLERVVQNLVAQVDDESRVTQNGIVQSSLPMATIADQLQRSDSGRNSPGSDDSGESGYTHRRIMDKDVGRLVINGRRSRYISNAFWAIVCDEISEMRDILDNPPGEDEDEDELESPNLSNSSVPLDHHQSFVFGYSSTMVKMRSFHPSPSQVFILWEVFKENVDPLVRVLHRPTAKNILINASGNTDGLSRPAEALLFAIYFGAVVSLTPDQCQSLLGETKDTLIKRYRFATEQALARAGFLNNSSLMLLQTFVFFLIFVRHQDDTRLVWSLSGLAIHLAQTLGIHRDGTNFNLSPFETEMRRRLWWHISILDTRSSEDHGTDPTFSEQFYNTKLPMNINDDDIYPDMKVSPKERVGCTEMTFCLLRFELSIVTRKLNFTAPGVDGPEGRKWTLEEKEKMINQFHKMIEEKYLRYCDMNIP
jgi:Fungal specific transcription factor domain/Fungal Zn(2)-Cys(6) binuclear cluster domain